MAILKGSPRVGRSQGALIFWGLVSVFFAAAFCYYFLENSENQRRASRLRDQVATLQDQNDSLSAEKEKMQSSVTETEKELKTREEFLQDKETKLAAEETRLEAVGAQAQNISDQSQAQASVVRKFDDTVRKLVKGEDTDVVLRGGRPVLRVPDSVFFGYGDATLKPGGKALLAQIAQSLDGELDNFELRVECYPDSGGEAQKASDDAPAAAKPKTPPEPKTSPDNPASPHFATGWELTAARTAALGRYFHDSTSLPFNNIILTARADSQPIVPDATEGHARNRRIEITITPVPAAYHSTDAAKPDSQPTETSKPKNESRTSDKPDVSKPKSEGKPADKPASVAKPKGDGKATAKNDSAKAKTDSTSKLAKSSSSSTTNAPSAKPPN